MTYQICRINNAYTTTCAVVYAWLRGSVECAFVHDLLDLWNMLDLQDFLIQWIVYNLFDMKSLHY